MKISTSQGWFLVPLRGHKRLGGSWGDCRSDGTGHGTTSTAFAGNWAFFSSPACRKTYSLCTGGRAPHKAMAAGAHRIGAFFGGGVRRMDFLTMRCGFEDVGADLLAEREQI